MQDIRTHKRILDTFTGPLERPLLRWLAGRMPAWVNPDILTGVGVLGALVTFAGYALCAISPNFLWLASFGFVINWFGDSLDGTLARYRHIERPIYGFYIDHCVDAFCEVLIFLGLGLSPYVHLDLALLALVGYLLVSVLVYVRTCVKGEFALSYGKLGPTEARMIAIGANTLVYLVGNPSHKLFGITFTIYDWVAIIVIGILAVISISTTYVQGRILIHMDAQVAAEKAAAAAAREKRRAEKARLRTERMHLRAERARLRAEKAPRAGENARKGEAG
jgi:archaetidylinositol phosphate synthase